MMKNYTDDELRDMTNDELEKELALHEWLHRDLLREYDERHADGRIKLGPGMTPEEFEIYFKKKCEERRRKKAS